MKQRRIPQPPLASLEDENEGGNAVAGRITAPYLPRADAPSTEGVIRKVRISEIVDSPYQPRRSYDPESIDELGKSLSANGQQEPVILRALPNNQFELIGGHRRKKAALNIGWDELDARIVVRTDEQAKKETLLQNEGREDLTEYERAMMYHMAINDGVVKNQTECAEVFATSQASVSKAIAMLDLPAPIIAMLDKNPALFGSSTASIIRDLLNDYPDNHDIVIQSVERLQEGASGSSLRGWVAQMVAHKKPASPRSQKSVITNRSGAPTFETRSKPERREVTISVKDKTIDMADFEQWIVAELRRRQEAGDQ